MSKISRFQNSIDMFENIRLGYFNFNLNNQLKFDHKECDTQSKLTAQFKSHSHLLGKLSPLRKIIVN